MPDHLVALVPLNERASLADFPPFQAAQEECEMYDEAAETVDVSEAAVVKDPALKCEAYELFGKATMDIPCKTELPYLVMQVKDVGKFFSFTITVADNERRLRRITATNKQSMARVKAYEASLPLVLKDGWNYVCMDLADLTERAFGTQYQRCKRVTIGSNCRLARLFFQDREYEDVELPSFLRVIK